MGCKQSKSAVRDGPEYLDGYNNNSKDGMEEEGLYPLETEINPAALRYVGSYHSGDGSQQKQIIPQPEQQVSSSSGGFCPSDAQFSKLAENCSSGLFEMFSFGGNTKLITDGPARENAYQQPAFNYQQPSESDVSHHSQAHSQGHHSQSSQQRRVIPVQNGSFSL